MPISYVLTRAAVPLVSAIQRLLRLVSIGPAASAAQQLLIMDFSYKRTAGHHHALNRLLLSAAKGKALNATVLANRYLDASLRSASVKATFKEGAYDAVDTPQALDQKARRILSSTTIDLIRHVLPGLRSAHTTVLIHTTTAWHLQALFQVMAACGSRSKVNAFLMFPLDFDVTPALVNAQTQAYLDAARFARAHGLNVRFLCENRLLAKTYQDAGLSDVSFRSLPCALPPGGGAPRPAHGNGPVFLFIGDPRADKGFAVLIRALSDIVERNLDMVIRLRLTSVPEAYAPELTRLRSKQLDLQVERFFSDETYYTELGQADAVLLPYDPQAYKIKNSNIVTEAICCGTPVIVPPGENSLSAQARSWPDPLHIDMTEYSAQGLVEALNAFASQAQALQAAASAAAPAARQQRAPGPFIDDMLA